MRRQLIYAGALCALVLLWISFLAVPSFSATETSVGRRLGRTVVTERLSGLGFSRAQARSVVQKLDSQRLAALAGGLGAQRQVSPFVGVFALLSLTSIFALLILTQ